MHIRARGTTHTMPYPAHVRARARAYPHVPPCARLSTSTRARKHSKCFTADKAVVVSYEGTILAEGCQIIVTAVEAGGTGESAAASLGAVGVFAIKVGARRVGGQDRDRVTFLLINKKSHQN